MPSAPPVPAYFLSAGTVVLGLHCFLRPRQEYGRFGLPLEQAAASTKKKRDSSSTTAGEGTVSPLIHLKGIREITYGLALAALKYQGHDDAVTAVAGVVSLAGLGDGIVILLNTGEEFRHKAFGHIGFGIVIGGWSLWRALDTGLLPGLR
ncbi:uncharacterized protein F4822DRAFT_400560 [Hypoxylon trugodes]|uniref:uncharacterized protein n=1 Tax=Hypoxylon trugodes TaxID=326681 RepID=UPI00219D530A|nr:uncharacterized protein F4822DRAFT_400560 [Hypoxylon trugodes]KAI1390026.1 hypothetical protein F4822DRAFT_400560 [Hypoxylon trugodes]